MMLRAIGCSFRSTPIAVREKLAFDEEKLTRALNELGARYNCEAVILSTCNRVELYLARSGTPAAPKALNSEPAMLSAGSNSVGLLAARVASKIAL